MASGAVFNKLSHLSEYILNKTFGDYKNLKMTLDNKIIVSMLVSRNYYYVQNIALAAIMTAISLKAIRILVLADSRSVIAIPLLVGSVAAPILFSLFNMAICHTGGYHGRWVEINGVETGKLAINKNDIRKISLSERVYCCFGAAPTYFPDEFTEGFD